VLSEVRNTLPVYRIAVRSYKVLGRRWVPKAATGLRFDRPLDRWGHLGPPGFPHAFDFRRQVGCYDPGGEIEGDFPFGALPNRQVYGGTRLAALRRGSFPGPRMWDVAGFLQFSSR